MAYLQHKGDGWYCTFRYKNRRHYFTVGEVEEIEARAVSAKVDYLLMRIKQHLITVPPGMDIVDFIQADGKPPEHYRPSTPKETVFADLRDAYLRTHGNGTIEQSTLDTCKLHLSHFASTLGETFPMNALTLADLQRHVDRRSKAKNRSGDPISPVTLKKEVATLAGVWIWGGRMGMVTGDYPARGIRYPKVQDPPPFMTWKEIERAIAAGGEPEELWECLYLTTEEIVKLLACVKKHAAHPFIYPMFCFAAHTGARRSEIMRAQVIDIDLAGQTALIHEKKRKRGARSHRRVPLTPFLARVLKDWLAIHPGGPHLFCISGVIGRSKKRSRTTGHKGDKTRASSLKGRLAEVRRREEQPPTALSRKEAHDHFKRTLAGSKWEVLKGWHVLRHSFISACASKGVDQRMLDDWVGHQTEEQRRRYRHLYPSTQQEAINLVFGKK